MSKKGNKIMTDTVKQLLNMMAEYHVWGYHQLFDSLQKVPDDAYFDSTVKLFFGSIHKTLNHLCLVDLLWYARFQQSSTSIKTLDQVLYSERNTLHEAILKGAEIWKKYVIDITIEVLNRPIEYFSTEQEKMQLIPAKTLLHVFNHGTHHRGQISSAITALGYPFQPMDLSYSPGYRKLVLL